MLYNKSYMKLILAQGNPDEKFNDTRHNVGFMILDLFAHKQSATWSDKKKFQASAAEIIINNEKIILIKPMTFYNETGISAQKLVNFYGLNASTDILVLHDDLALPFGTIRTRKEGSDAGNNGIKSLNSHIGTDYHRIRIGIWNELRDRMDDADFVLGHFSKTELDRLDKDIAPHVLTLIDQFCHDNLVVTSHSL